MHEGDGILLHRCRLSLWGKVSVREFKANLSTRSGRVMIVDDQSWGALLSSRMGWFCFARPVLWANRALVSASSTLVYPLALKKLLGLLAWLQLLSGMA